MQRLICLFAILLLPALVIAEEPKIETPTKEKSPYERFAECWGSVCPLMRTAPHDQKPAVIKEHWQRLAELRDLAVESPLTEEEINSLCMSSWSMLSDFYSPCDEEFRKVIFDSTNAFFEHIKEKPEFHDFYDQFFEAVQVFPLKTKFMQMDELPDVTSQLKLMAELYATLKKYEFREGSYAIYELSDLFWGGLNTFDSHFKNPAMRKVVLPVAKNFGTLLGSKQNSRFQSYGKMLNTMVERVESEGKKSPWDEMPFVAMDGREMKIADFRGKTLLLVFQPMRGPQIPLLKHCEQQWGEKGLAVLAIAEHSPDSAKKIIDLCGVEFPVWLEWERLKEKELKLPQLSAPVFANYMLLGKDGNVVNPYFGGSELIGELIKALGPVQIDIQNEVDALPGKVRGGTLLKYAENMTLDEQIALMQDITAVMVSQVFGTLDEGLIKGFEQLVDLAEQIAEKSNDRIAAERAYASLFLIMEMNYNYSVIEKNPGVLTKIRESAAKHGLEQIVMQVQLEEFALRLAELRYPNELDEAKILACRDELFAFLDVNKGTWQAASLIAVLRSLEYALYRCNDEMQAEAYSQMATYLADATDEATKKQGRMYLGMARRYALMSKPMPIEGVTIDGKTFDQKPYLGKIVLVDFWATWCGPCLAEVPNMKALYEKYHDQEGFDIISISTDDNLEALESFHKKRPLPWVCLVDQKLEDVGKESMSVRYGVTAIPTMLLLDREGKVIMFEARGTALAEKLAEIFD